MLFSLVFEWLIPCAFPPIILISSFQNTLRLYVCVCVCTGVCRHAGVSEDSSQDLILPLWRQGLSCFCYAVYSSLAGSWASRLFYCLNLPSPYRTAGITDVHHWIWLFLCAFWKSNPNCWTCLVSIFTHQGILLAYTILIFKWTHLIYCKHF